MVFGLFKKKKKVPEDGTQETAKPEKPTKSSKKKEKTPKNLKETTNGDTQHPTEPQRIQDDNEDQWKYDSIVQFLQSPLWQIPLVEFVDEHCSIFDNPKQDKPEYKEIHEAYKKMVEGLVEDMLCELEIEIEKFTEIVHAGVNDKTYKKTFEQFMTVDNYTVFKKIMFKRNKELELEALQQLHEIDKQKASDKGNKESKESKEESERVQKENEQDILKLMQEKEEAELEHALALSLAVEEERQKLIEQEDGELQEAMRQSEIEYSKFQKDVKEQQEQIEHEKKAKQEELERYEREKHEREELKKQRERELAKEKEIARVHAEEVARKKSQEIEAAKSLTEVVEEEKIEHRPEETKSQQDLSISHKKLQPLQNAPKASLPELAEKRSIFPPIKGSAGYDPMADYTPEVEKKPVKHEIKDETLEERKKRLQTQRDLILAKKKAERNAELKNYEAKRGSTQKFNTQKSMGEDVSNQEIVRRKEIYGKLKGEL